MKRRGYKHHSPLPIQLRDIEPEYYMYSDEELERDTKELIHRQNGLYQIR